MSGTALLEALTTQGVSLFVKEGKLTYRAKPGVITPTIKARLAANKTELLSILAAKEAKNAKKAQPEISGNTPKPCRQCGTPMRPVQDGYYSCTTCFYQLVEANSGYFHKSQTEGRHAAVTPQ